MSSIFCGLLGLTPCANDPEIDRDTPVPVWRVSGLSRADGLKSWRG